MPARLNTETRVVHGNRTIVVGTDEAWRFGPAEGRWYIGMFIFAIGILLYTLAWPWLYETATGQSWRFRQQQNQVAMPAGQVWTSVQNHPAPVATPSPQVVPVPAPQVAAPSPFVPPDPTAGMSPEDLRLYERLVLRK